LRRTGDTARSAGEVYSLNLHSGLPIDAARVPRVVIPFADESRKTVFGSLAVDPSSRDLLLGEENGNRIYRLRVDHQLQAVIVGLNHLLGGTSLTLDGRGRLIFLDYEGFVTHLRSQTPLPPVQRPTHFDALGY
jgi:hypothetical protein